VTSLSMIIRIHWRKHSTLDLRRIVHVHFTRIYLPLSFMNRWFAFHGCMVVIRQLCLARILS
jgi:hypothetical protein